VLLLDLDMQAGQYMMVLQQEALLVQYVTTRHAA
jgi:hypothetical protein